MNGSSLPSEAQFNHARRFRLREIYAEMGEKGKSGLGMDGSGSAFRGSDVVKRTGGNHRAPERKKEFVWQMGETSC